MNRRDIELLDRQLSGLNPPRNDGLIAITTLIVFCVGIAVGGALFAQHDEARVTPDIAIASSTADQGPILR